MHAHYLPFLLTALLVAGGDDAKKKAVDKDMAAMQGEWRVVRGEYHGKTFDVTDDSKMTIRGDRYSDRDGPPTLSIKIDPTCNPKLLDLTFLMAAGNGNVGTILEGVYRIDGDTMT